MSDIVVLCPTRERPGKAAEMMDSFRRTALLVASEMILVIDDDDPCLPEYRELPRRFNDYSAGVNKPPNELRLMVIPVAEGGSLARATNTAAARVWDDDVIIGHVGDDHRFESVGWDRRIVDTLVQPGIAYGDDGFWGQRLPTAAFLSAIIPRTLGWYALPTSLHYGIDDAWGDIGRQIGRLWYLPDVKITQPGPYQTSLAGDDVYWRAQEHRAADSEAYYVWRDQGGMAHDMERLRAAL